jgi:hypothetical protein
LVANYFYSPVEVPDPVIPSSDPVTYKIYYYLDGNLSTGKTETRSVESGTTLTASNCKPKSVSGYTLDTVSYPSGALTASGGKVYAYYKSAPTANAYLYSDSSYTKLVSTIKSGYGMYGLVTVDISNYDGGSNQLLGCSTTATYSNGSSNITKSMTGTASGSNYLFIFQVNNSEGTGLRKVYVPIKWADESYYTVSFTTTIQYRTWINSGYIDDDDNWVDTSHWSSTKTATKSTSASVYVNGNMYEDDFTGGK